MKTGCPMEIIIQPYDKLRKLSSVDISEEAQSRLKFIDWYKLKSEKYSENHKRNVALTCRHFGISRSYFYFWYSRFKKSNFHLKSLESLSKAPKKYRKLEYNKEIINRIREIRQENPTYAARKIRKILQKEIKRVPSRATIGRIIKKYKMFYKPGQIEEHRKRVLLIEARKKKNRIPYMVRAIEPREIIEFDMSEKLNKNVCKLVCKSSYEYFERNKFSDQENYMKHISMMGGRLYAMCGIDQYTKRCVIHICSTPSSENAKKALKKIVEKFGPNIKIHNDNGSENMGKAEEYLKENNIEQFWARAYKPKDKAIIERFIGTYQREFLDFHYGAYSVSELQSLTDKWIEKYENYRPHDSLDLMTPKEFEKNYYKKTA